MLCFSMVMVKYKDNGSLLWHRQTMVISGGQSGQSSGRSKKPSRKRSTHNPSGLPWINLLFWNASGVVPNMIQHGSRKRSSSIDVFVSFLAHPLIVGKKNLKCCSMFMLQQLNKSISIYGQTTRML